MPVRREERACTCSAADLARHRRRLSGPLLDRIDVSLTVGRPAAAAMRRQAAPGRPTFAPASSPPANARPRGSRARDSAATPS
jgi:magnesium chelatase family protein